jgi:hypothetical protein
MKTIVRSLSAMILGVALATEPADATSRINTYAQMNPISSWVNLAQRYQRLSDGAKTWNEFGSNSNFAGAFSNLQISPSGSLNVVVGQNNTSFPGTLYGLGVVDSASYPASQPSGATGLSLPSDSTKLVLEAILTANTPSIGMTAGTSAGQSVVNLIECKPSIVDQTPQTINLITSAGGSGGTASVNRDRVDTLSCQAKISASSPAPTVPTADAGYTAFGYVTVPNGTATVTSGMITNYASFYGFALANQSNATAIDTSSTAQTKTGVLTDTGGFFAGVSGSPTVAGALSYGTDTGGFTSSTLASNNASYVVGVPAEMFGVFGEPAGTNLLSLDHNGNLGVLNTAYIGAAAQVGAGYFSTASEGSAELTYPSNNNGNKTAIAENVSAGYPYFAVAKESSGGAFQNWLFGVDSGLNFVVPSGIIKANNGLTSGGTSTFNGLVNANNSTDWLHSYSSGCGTVNWNSSNSNTAAGVNSTGFGAFCNGNTTALLNVDSSGNVGIRNNLSVGGIAGSNGVVTHNAAGQLSTVTPGAANNILISNGTSWVGGGATGTTTNPGYQNIPGSQIIIQWGVTNGFNAEGSQTVTFPQAFPHSLLSVTATLQSNAPGVSIDQGCQVGGLGNPTSIQIYMQQYGGGVYTYPQYCTWMAIGY